MACMPDNVRSRGFGSRTTLQEANHEVDHVVSEYPEKTKVALLEVGKIRHPQVTETSLIPIPGARAYARGAADNISAPQTLAGRTEQNSNPTNLGPDASQL